MTMDLDIYLKMKENYMQFYSNKVSNLDEIDN